MIDLIRRERPRVVGVSIMYDLHITDAVRLIECARIADPDVFIVLGGAFCTYNAKLILESVPSVDCVTFGEAELTIVGLLDRLSAGRDWRDVPGIYFHAGDRVRTSGMPVLPDLAQLVWPARDTLAANRAAGVPTPVASTFTSRGCHAKCTFCYAPRQPGVHGNPWRFRPAVDVVDEIEYLQRDFGTRFIWFNDDNFGGAFTDGFRHTMEFAEEMIRRELKISFHCEFRVDSGLIDHEVLDVLTRAGLRSALLGIESGSPSMLKRFRKGTTVAYNFDAARIFRAKQIELDPGWIMIDPETTLDELWEDLEFIITSDIHRNDNPFVLINRAIALRGTEMFDLIDPARVSPGPAGGADPASVILRQARREYRVTDTRVEDLWEVWSSLGGKISDRRDADVPFMASRLAQAARSIRRSGGTGSATPLALLAGLRRWRNGLPELFSAFITLSLLLADGDPPGLRAALETQLQEMVDEYDRSCTGFAFDDLVGHVRENYGSFMPVPHPTAA